MPCRVPSSPHGPWRSGKTTSTEPSVCGTWAASVTTRSVEPAAPSSATIERVASTSGRVDPLIASREASSASSTQRPSVAMPTGTTSYFSRSIAASTLPAVTQEIPCSLDRPPKTTATRGFWCSFIAMTLSAYAGRHGRRPAHPCLRHFRRPPDSGPALRPSTIAVTAGRPAHEPDAPLNAPITMASTFVAGGDLEYGRYANPTWTALEDTLGALEGGRCLTFASGMAAVTTVLDLVGQRRQGGRAPPLLQRHDPAAGRPRGARPDQGRARGHHRHRRRGQGVRRRRPGLARVADQPGARARGHRDDHGRRPRGRGVRRRRQHLRHSPAADAARAGRRPRRALRDQVPRRAQRRPARRDLHARRRALRRAQEPSRPDGRHPRHVRGVAGPARHAHPAPPRGARPGQRAGAGAPAAGPPGDRRGPLPRLRRNRLDRARAGRDRRRPAHPQDEAVGARHVARRRRVDPRAPSPLEGRGRRPSPKALSGSPSGSRTSRTSGTTCAPLSTAAWAVAVGHVRSAPDDVSSCGARSGARRRPDGARAQRASSRRRSASRGTSRSQPWCRGR